MTGSPSLSELRSPAPGCTPCQASSTARSSEIPKGSNPAGSPCARNVQKPTRCLNARGRVIPLPRADAYLAAYAASPGGSVPDQLYALAGSGPVAPGPGRTRLPGRGRALASARSTPPAGPGEAGTPCYIYGDGMALVATMAEPAGRAHYTVTPDGRWSRVAGHLATQRQRARSATPPLPDRRPWQSSRPARGQHSRAGPTRHRHPGRGPARAAGNL